MNRWLDVALSMVGGALLAFVLRAIFRRPGVSMRAYFLRAYGTLAALVLVGLILHWAGVW